MPTTDHLANATFGVEFECYLPEGASTYQAAQAVNARLGAGRCVSETYNHLTRNHWKIVTDGSLGDTVRGMELVSPVLRGEAGLREIEAACKALSDFGCTVAKKCGFHVHVGAGTAPLGFFKNLVKLYGMFEPVIDAMMPVSRRASNNAYCRSMTAANPAVIDRAADLSDLIRAAGGTIANESRYYKVNLSAYRRHRTVEFRQHSGTLDGTKARRWTELCLRMVATARRDDLRLTNGAAAPRNQARPGSKAYRIGEMMLRPEGVTATEVRAAMNWPSVSLPQQAGICGLAFTTQRTGREVRYFAVQAAAPARIAVSIDGFAETIGATDEERAYMAQRTNDLAGPIAWAA